MSGIAGVWNLDSEPVDRDVIASLSARLAHRGGDGEGVWVEGPIGLACHLNRITPESLPEVQPLVHGSGAVAVFDGRLDDREGLIARLPSSERVSGASSDPALVLAAYERYGEEFLDFLSGDFALALFDPRRQRLILGRDAVGLRPLYYCWAGSTVVFASEIKALQAHPGVSLRPDDDGLAEFLLVAGQPDSAKTCFAGISSVPPAHRVTITPHGSGVRRYWDFDTEHRLRLPSFGDYVEGFHHYFEQAVRRRLRSAHPVAVAVSGGLDSSSIFCLAETLRRREPNRYPPVLGFSNAYPAGSPADETAYLIEVERQSGLGIERIPWQPAGPVDGAREEIWHVEAPLVDTQWTANRAIQRTSHGRGARVLLTGHWGDNVLWDLGYLIDLARQGNLATVRVHLRQQSRWFADIPAGMFRQRFIRDFIRYHVPDSVLPLLRRLRRMTVGGPAPDHAWYTQAFWERVRVDPWRRTLAGKRFSSAHVRSLYSDLRSKFAVSALEWNNKVASMHGLEVAFPFLDRDLVSFLMMIPGTVLSQDGVPKALLRAAMRGTLPETVRQRRTKADFTDVINRGVERDHPRLVEFLRPRSLAVDYGYVKAQAVESRIPGLQGELRTRDDILLPRALSSILALELWLRIFFERESPEEESRAYAASY